MDTAVKPVLDLVEAIEDTFRFYGNPPQGMETTLVFNREQGHFVMLHRGCYYDNYENHVAAHLELRGDEILVHDEDAGMNFIAPNLIRQGVPRDKIKIVAHPDYHIEEA